MTDMLLFDLSNMMYYCAHRLHRGFERRPDAASLILAAGEDHMRSVYRRFKPQQFLFACDHASYWRKAIFPDYKAHREETPVKLLVRRAIEGFKEKHAKYCVEVENCEADDVIFVASQAVCGHKVIVSSDRDFMQLMNPEIKVFNPLESRFRQTEHSAAFEIFLKCIRGDVSDNIPSAFPRVTEKRLKKAFADPDYHAEMMQTKLKDDTIVADNYARNRQLIDLTQIPQHLQDLIEEALLPLLVKDVA